MKKSCQNADYLWIMEIHLGKKVEEIISLRGMTKAEFARRINKHRETVANIFERESIDSALLAKISEVLQYNFFKYLAGTILVDETGSNVYNESEPVINESDLKEKYFAVLEKYTALLEESKSSGPPPGLPPAS